MNFVDVNIKLVEGGVLPEYKHNKDACCDCYARLNEEVTLEAWGHITIPLGFKLQLPEGFKAVINPRSGLASKNGVFACIGQIDEPFIGEVGCTLFNHSNERLQIKNKDRICQIEFTPYYQANFQVVDKLSETERGESGFGSTGL